MNIDIKAPLKAKKDILIDAPVNHVWKIQSDINSWPKWQKDVSFAKLQGKLVKGTIFTWKAKGMNITSEIQEVNENKTKIITEESLSGWFPRLIKFFKPDFLEQSLLKALQKLKNQAERTK